MIALKLNDGNGTNKKAKILQDNELLVSSSPSPPLLPQKYVVFSQFFTTDGTATGSNDMGIDGSVNNVEFYIQADEEDDIYISKLSIIVGYGASSYLYNFVDSGAALANGVKISYTNSENDEIEIATLTRNYSFLRLAETSGVLPTSWELRNLLALNDYGFICTVDLSRIIYPYGVKLDRFTRQRMSVLIQDDCTDADLFNIRALGFKRFE